jgi:hypothetical protein
MKKAKLFLLLAGLAFITHGARATSVIPPTFDQLVADAEVIFQGSVTEVKSQWAGEGGQRHIVTYVTFKVDDALKGNPGETYTIRMLGGTVDGESMGVSDAPTFNVGDKQILFVENNGSQFIPLVGIMYGQFRVQPDESGKEVVTSNDGQPLKNVARLGKEDANVQSAEPNLTAADFKAAIQKKLQSAK